MEAARAGVGRSRSRHGPPTIWIIEGSPDPLDERRVAKAADAGATATSEAAVDSCWRPKASVRRNRSRRVEQRNEGARAVTWTVSETCI
jgi:hypothetical protein